MSYRMSGQFSGFSITLPSFTSRTTCTTFKNNVFSDLDQDFFTVLRIRIRDLMPF
jgi:hypothetical protein